MQDKSTIKQLLLKRRPAQTAVQGGLYRNNLEANLLENLYAQTCGLSDLTKPSR
jgi:hypothetical protein